jgi:hypothetical protein
MAGKTMWQKAKYLPQPPRAVWSQKTTRHEQNVTITP